jgi:hypothetical protein
MLIWNMELMKRTTKNTVNKIIKPVIPLVILDLASAIFSLLPPDVIHSTPPQRIINKKAIKATANIKIIRIG